MDHMVTAVIRTGEGSACGNTGSYRYQYAAIECSCGKHFGWRLEASELIKRIKDHAKDTIPKVVSGI
jgi:hypothetical protein